MGKLNDFDEKVFWASMKHQELEAIEAQRQRFIQKVLNEQQVLRPVPPTNEGCTGS